jgi:hypothetical protein
MDHRELHEITRFTIGGQPSHSIGAAHDTFPPGSLILKPAGEVANAHRNLLSLGRVDRIAASLLILVAQIDYRSSAVALECSESAG